MLNGPKVSIVVVNYKSYELTINCIKSLYKLHYPHFNIIIVDSASPNNSFDELQREFFESHTIIAAKQNKGYAAGCNIGAKEALKQGAKYALILNNDTIIEDPDMLNILITECEKRDDCAWIGPKVLTNNGKMQGPHFRSDLAHYIWKHFSESVMKKAGLTQKLSNQAYQEKVLTQKVSKVNVIIGACMLINLEYLRLVNFFDENTFLYYEEEILAEKFRSIGKACYFVSETHIYHLGEATIRNPGRHIYTKPARDSFKYYLRKYREFNSFERNLILFSTAVQNILYMVMDRVKKQS